MRLCLHGHAILGLVIPVAACTAILGIEDRPAKPASVSSAAASGGSAGHPGSGGEGAGDVIWAHRFGDGSAEHGTRVAVDSRGGVLVGAWFSGVLTFDRQLHATGNYDSAALKLTADGAPEWSLHIKDASGAAEQYLQFVGFDASDTPYIGGVLSGQSGIDDTPYPTLGMQDIFLAKLSAADGSPSQVWQWANGHNLDVLLDAAGMVLLGTFTYTLDFQPPATPLTASGFDAFVASLDLTGTALWAAPVVTGDDTFLARGVRHGDAIFAVGSRGGLSTVLQPLLQAFSSDGQPGVQATAAGSGVATDVAIAGDGTVVVTGHFTGQLGFDSTQIDGVDGDDIFVAGFPAGAPAWALRFGGPGPDRPEAIVTSPNGNLVLAGGMSSALDFGSGATSHAGGMDMFVVELTSRGECVKAVVLGGEGDQWAADVAFDPSGNLVLGGLMEGTLGYDGTVLTSAGATDVVVAKLVW